MAAWLAKRIWWSCKYSSFCCARAVLHAASIPAKRSSVGVGVVSEVVGLAVAFRLIGGGVETSWEAGVDCCSDCTEGIAGLVCSCCFRRLFSRLNAAFSCFKVSISALIACNSLRISACVSEEVTYEGNDDGDGALRGERWQLTFVLSMPDGGSCAAPARHGRSGRPQERVPEALAGCSGGKSVAQRVPEEVAALAYDTAGRRGW